MIFDNQNVDAKQYSPLALAFIGDGVYNLMVKEKLLTAANRPNGDLHALSVEKINAVAQSDAVAKIKDHLTEEELAVYKRGRNAHTPRAPKKATIAQYHSATGLEALFGFLYLSGQNDRMIQLFNLIHSQE